MKTRILGLILMLCGLFDLHAQNNYLLAGSKAGMEVQLRGALLLNQMKTDTSEISPSEKLWFKSPAGFSGQLVQAGPLNVILRNLTAGWMKVSVYDLTKTRLLRTVNVAPGYTEFWGYLSSENIDADKDYYWLFEDISLQTPQLIADTKTVQGDTFEYLNVLDNDRNLLPTMRARLKAGQTINPAIVVTAFDEQGNTKISATTAGTYTFLYEVVNGTTLIAEQTVTVVVGNRSEFCDLHIAEFKLKTGSNTVYVANLTSISANINPFNWKIMNIQTGATLKSGTTPPADDNLEEIDFSGLETGTYRFVISSSVRTCSDIISVSYVKPSEACNLNIVSIDKVTGTNNYTVNITYSGTTSIKYSANLSTVFGTNISANTFRINLDNVASGSYSLRTDGENGKFCNYSKDFQHTLVAVSPATGRLETYIKYIANYPDNWVIGGTQSRGGTRDYDTQWRASDRATNTIWQTYISDFNNLGNSTSAQASIGLQKDTARSSANVSLVVTPSKISLLQRATANASTQEVAFVQDITAPLWLRIEKTGANITAKYSKTESNTPVWTTVGTITNATTNWATYWKNIGVGSAKTDAVTDARFRGHLGGNVAFNTAPAIIAPPVLASLTGTPTSGANITLTATGCVAPNITTWYKNLSTSSAGTGNSLAIVAASGDYYYATCVNGTRKSVNSNIIALGSLGSESGTPTAPVETAEVLITLGESNAGDRVPNSYASASELGVHAKVKTVNNSTLAIESLNIGVNNALGQNDITNGTTHGWDLSIAKAIDDGTINLPQIYLVEAAQGGALLGQWNDDIPDGYFKKFEARLNAMKTHLTGKNINYTVLISLGINNAIAGSAVYDDAHFPNLRGQIYFKVAYKNLYAKIRGILGANTKIVGTKFFGTYGTYCNTIFDEISAENPAINLFVDASNLSRIVNDDLHYNYESTKTIASSMIAKVNYFQSINTIAAPVISSSPASVIAGTPVTFTAVGCSSSVSWYANSSIAGSTTSITVASPIVGVNYSAKCNLNGSQSNSSNYIQVISLGGSSGTTPVAIFTNPFTSVAVETERAKFSPQKFASITPPKSTDAITGEQTYNWNVLFQVDGKNFTDNNRTMESVGLTGSPDYVPVFYNGIGRRGIDFVYPFDPNTGLPWSADTYTNPATNISAFVSAIPFARRYYSNYGVTIRSNDGGATFFDPWANFTKPQFYDEGVSAASSIMLGGGDKVNGRYKTYLVGADIELNYENGGEGLTAFMLGMSNTAFAYKLSKYSQIFNTLGYILPNCYPDANGNISSSAPLNQSWLPNFRISIPERSISNKGLIDDPSIIVGGEVSSYSSSTFENGSTYDVTGGGVIRTINKFGTSANTEHSLARIIANTEQQRWYIDNKLDGRMSMFMTKISADRGDYGRLQGTETNESLKLKHFNRRNAAMIGFSTFFAKTEWLIWDRNSQEDYVDCYNGVFGMLNLVNQKKQFSTENLSATDLYKVMKPDLWKTQISYNGTTFFEHKGSDIQASASNLPCRTAKAVRNNKKYMLAVCFRPERIEPTECWLKENFDDGTSMTIKVNTDSWMTTNPLYHQRSGSEIPNSDKDIFYTIVEYSTAQ